MTYLSVLLLASNPPVGRIQGGWPYVWAAYLITWAGVALYTFSLLVRSAKAERPEPEQP